MNKEIYFGELKSLIEYVLISIEDINKSLEDGNTTRFWYSIQSFLISVGNISKILYPTYNPKKTNKVALERGKKLRESLSLLDESILSEKTLRNCFEHYDEKIDEFLKKSNGSYVSKIIAGKGQIVVNGKSDYFLRYFNPETKVLKFKSNEYNMQLVINEIIKLKAKIQTVLY